MELYRWLWKFLLWIITNENRARIEISSNFQAIYITKLKVFLIMFCNRALLCNITLRSTNMQEWNMSVLGSHLCNATSDIYVISQIKKYIQSISNYSFSHHHKITNVQPFQYNSHEAVLIWTFSTIHFDKVMFTTTLITTK